MKRMLQGLWTVGVVGSLVVSVAQADDQDVIDYRQHIMNTLEAQAAALGQILSGAAPEDNVDKHLEIIALTASTALKSFEPKVQGGESKPAVWASWADFSKRMNEFAAATAKAAAEADKGDKHTAAVHMADALSCKGCHDLYRDSKD